MIRLLGSLVINCVLAIVALVGAYAIEEAVYGRSGKVWEIRVTAVGLVWFLIVGAGLLILSLINGTYLNRHAELRETLEGERFMARVYNAIRTNPALWRNTALLIVYDEHGGIYDHVPPPQCTPDGYIASAEATGTGAPFAFDRLGVRVPAVLISPWIPRGTIVPGTEDPVNGKIFEHASIPATVTEFFLNGDAKRTVREEKANTFLSLLTDNIRADDDCVVFRNLD